MLWILVLACGDNCEPYDPGGGTIVCTGRWEICCNPNDSTDCYVVAPDGSSYARNQAAEQHMYCEQCSMDSFSEGMLCGA